MRFFGSLADRMLGRLVPEVEAAAACIVTRWTEYKCNSDGREFTRTCTEQPNCTTTCTTWRYIGWC